MTDDAANTYLTPNEAAKILMVSPITVRQWAQKGLLPFRSTAGGHRRFLQADVLAFAAARQGQGKTQRRVLVVDDDRALATFLCTLFSAQPGQPAVEVAYDGFEAGRLVTRFGPDLVLLDIMMPGMDGFEVCRRLKQDKETAGIRVVAITGQPTQEAEQRMRAAGADDFLAKPFSNETLLAACGFGPAAQQNDQERAG